MNSPSLSESPSTVRAGLVGAAIAFLPAVGYVLCGPPARAPWPAVVALGGACAVAAGLLFAAYFRFATAFVQRRTLRRRMRVAAASEPQGLLVDPLAQEELELAERFAELEPRELARARPAS